uniref:NADH dehydrogenase [ubiquinone] iron-sulfur protein 4, mitochondrial n=1 Tax=Leucosporidium scottii TaxID=5278 RepID=A0A0H5G9U9_9BASI|nr:hypothetical protein ls5930a1_00127 [Leucosporidium scottii]
MSFLVRRSALPTLRAFSTSASAASSSSVPAASEAPKAVAERPEGSVVQAGVVSGAPDEIFHRPVRIYRPSPPSTQSAKATSHHWRIDWDILPGANRWENPLMGWASSADYMQGTHLKFDTKEQAIHFCEKQGYEFFVQEPHKSKSTPKNYAVNYKYSAAPLRIAHTK